MALYFYFNETTGDLVYSDKSSYSGSGYTSLGQQTDIAPTVPTYWVFHSQRANIKTVTKDQAITAPIDVLTSMRLMFYDCSSLISLDLSGFDTSNITSMYSMFNGCSSLSSLDLSGFDTSKVTDMSYMFDSCRSLTSLDLSMFDTSNVTNMEDMFFNCSALTSLDLSGFDTSKVTNMRYMFLGTSSSLRIIDISPNMSNVLSVLTAATYYDAFTRQAYAKADIPGGSTYVRNLADLDLVSTMIQDRAAIKAAEHEMMAMVNNLAKEIAALKVGA